MRGELLVADHPAEVALAWNIPAAVHLRTVSPEDQRFTLRRPGGLSPQTARLGGRSARAPAVLVTTLGS